MVTLRYDQKGEPRVLANNVRMNTAIASFIVRCDTRTAEPHQVVIALRTPGKPSAAVAEFRDQKAIAALSENNSVAFGDTALKLACH